MYINGVAMKGVEVTHLGPPSGLFVSFSRREVMSDREFSLGAPHHWISPSRVPSALHHEARRDGKFCTVSMSA